MAIRFRCTNIVRFDSAEGKYEYCRAELEAVDDASGGRMSCPTCGGESAVPLVSDAEFVQVVPAKAAVKHERATASVSRQTELSPTTARAAPTLKFSSFAGMHRCTRCGGTLDKNFRCQECGYQAAIRVTNNSLDPQSIRPAGFQLYLLQRFSPNESAGTLMFAMHSLAFLVTLIMLIMSLLGGGLGMVITLTFLSVFWAGYFYVIYQTRRIARRSPGRLCWWQRAGWRMVLFVLRATRWRLFSSGSAYHELSFRKQKATEQQVLAQSELPRYQVLDLEGVAMTDAGISRLHGLSQLRRLVLIGSEVSDAAVFRLQQALPNAWIWK